MHTSQFVSSNPGRWYQLGTAFLTLSLVGCSAPAEGPPDPPPSSSTSDAALTTADAGCACLDHSLAEVVRGYWTQPGCDDVLPPVVGLADAGACPAWAWDPVRRNLYPAGVVGQAYEKTDAGACVEVQPPSGRVFLYLGGASL